MSVTMEPVRDERYPTWQAQFIGEHKERKARLEAAPVVDRGINLRPKPEEPAPPVAAPAPCKQKRKAPGNRVVILPRWPFDTKVIMAYRSTPRAPIELIQKLVAHHYNVSRTDMVSQRRQAHVVRPRQVAMYLSRMVTLRSFPYIGTRFGDRDHTTVIHAARRIAALRLTDPSVAIAVNAVAAILSQAGMDVEPLGVAAHG